MEAATDTQPCVTCGRPPRKTRSDEGQRHKSGGGRIPETERNREILMRFTAGESVASIARSFGITRERGRQIVRDQVGQGVIDAQHGTNRDARAERRAERAVAPVPGLACLVCLGPISVGRAGADGQAKTCSARCADLWRVARLYLSPEAKAKWSAAIMRNYYSKPHKPCRLSTEQMDRMRAIWKEKAALVDSAAKRAYREVLALRAEVAAR